MRPSSGYVLTVLLSEKAAFHLHSNVFVLSIFSSYMDLCQLCFLFNSMLKLGYIGDPTGCCWPLARAQFAYCFINKP